MKRFQLVRDVDVSGVSGIGVVAEGVVWDNNKATVHWFGERQSIVMWDSIEDAIAIHGHGGATRVVWIDEDPHTTLTWDEMVDFVVRLGGQASYAVGVFEGYTGIVPMPSEIERMIGALRPHIDDMAKAVDDIIKIEIARRKS